MLNERIKNLRLAKGLTLQQVGDAFSISKCQFQLGNQEKPILTVKDLKRLLTCTGLLFNILLLALKTNHLAIAPLKRSHFGNGKKSDLESRHQIKIPG